MGRGRDESGFTLIEMLVIVVIALVLLAVALPNLMAQYRRERIRAAGRDWQEMARFGRATAILEGRTVRLTLRPEERRFRLSREDDMAHEAAPSRAVAPPKDTLLAKRAYAESVSPHLEFTGRSAGREGDTVRFRPDGRCDQALLHLVDPRYEDMTIGLDPITGRTRVLGP